MTRKFRALLWEQWLNSRVPLVVLFALLGAGQAALLALTVLRKVNPDILTDFVSFSWTFGVIIIFVPFVHGTLRDLRLDFPRRMFTLPASASTLFWAQWGYKALVALAVGGLVGGVNGLLLRQWCPAIYFPVTVYLCLICGGQLLACLGTAFGGVRGALLFVILSIGAILVSDSAMPRAPLFWAFGAVAAVLLAWVVTAWTRRGGSGLTLSLPNFHGGRLGKAQLRFVSPRAAQCWFEWRNVLWAGSWASAAYLLVLWVCPLVAHDLDTSQFAVFSFPLFQVMVSFGLGFYLTVGSERTRTFLFTKPMTSPALSWSKLRAGAQYSLAMFVVWTVLYMLFSTERGMGDMAYCFLTLFPVLMAGRELLLLLGGIYLLVLLAVLPIATFPVCISLSDEVASAVVLAVVTLLCGGAWRLAERRDYPGKRLLRWIMTGLAAGVPCGAMLSLLHIDPLDLHMDPDLLPFAMPLILAPYALAAGIFAEARARALVPPFFFTRPGVLLLFGLLACTWVDFLASEYAGISHQSFALLYGAAGPTLAAFAWLPLFTTWQRNR